MDDMCLSLFRKSTMADTDVKKAFENDDAALEFGLDIRRRIAVDMTKDGLPQDAERVGTLLKILDGVDKVALSRKRIEADLQSADMLASSAVVAEVLSQVNRKTAFRVEGGGRGRVIDHDAIVIPETVPGEMSVNPDQVDYDSFMKKFDEIE